MKMSVIVTIARQLRRILERKGSRPFHTFIRSRGDPCREIGSSEEWQQIIDEIEDDWANGAMDAMKIEDKGCVTHASQNLRGFRSHFWVACKPNNWNRDWPYGRFACLLHSFTFSDQVLIKILKIISDCWVVRKKLLENQIVKYLSKKTVLRNFLAGKVVFLSFQRGFLKTRHAQVHLEKKEDYFKILPLVSRPVRKCIVIRW